MIFKGSGVALVTPFKKDGTVDYAALENLVEFQINNGTKSIIACGTTGEPSTLSDDEQIETVKFIVQKVNKRVPVIAGAGSNHTEHGIELCKRSQSVGADGVLVVTPYYNKTTQKGLIEHYTDIAKSIDIPIVIYNVPSRTGLNILPSTLKELSKIDNIVAVKEANYDLNHIIDLVYNCHGLLDIYSGNDDNILPILSYGGVGVISAAANVIPKEIDDICNLYFENKLEESLKLQLKFLPLIKALFIEVNPIPAKTALYHMGYLDCVFRKPLTTMSENNEKILLNELKSLGINIK